MSRRAMTVLGPLEPERLGVTLTHEHVLFEQRPKLPLPELEAVSARALAEATVEMRHIGLLRRQPSAIRDNWRVADVELAAREVLEFRDAGGGAIVEVSSRGVGRDPIGLRAAGRAQRETGAPVSVHIYNYRPNRLAHHVLDVLAEEGADVEKTVICHLDTRPDVEYAQSIADRGAFIEFDTFGMEFVFDASCTQFPRDSERVALVAELVRRGYLSQILLSHDVCWKSLLVSYGGYGYAHLSRHVEPWLRHAGLSLAQIRTMRVDNPARWLAFEC